MKIVEWMDNDGRRHKCLLRDGDDERLASAGVPLDPPDLTALNWDGLVIDLHNALVKRGLSTWDDVLQSQNGIPSVLLSVLKRPIIGLYRERDAEAKRARDLSGG